MSPETGAAVAVFQKDLGTWDAELEIRPAPGVPVVRQRGVSVRRLLGGKWLLIDHDTDSGFAGHGIYGWDGTSKKYVGTWVDVMQTAMAQSEGTWDAATRTMTFITEVVHDGRRVRYREVTENVDDDTQVYRHYLPMPDGSEFLMILATYKRRKPAAA